MNKKLKKTAIKATKKVITKTKKTILNNTDTNITETLKKKVFPYLVNDIINALQTAKNGESIRIGKLGRIKKTFSQRKVYKKLYSFNRYSFKAFSTLKNN